MKHILIIIFLVSMSFTGHTQQKYWSSINLGIPVNKSTDWTSLNYDVNLLLGKNISKHSSLAVGSSYLTVDLLRSNTYLTFDRKILSFFGSYKHEVSLSEKIKILPQLRIGYSFIRSKLNEFPDETQKTGGVYIAEELCFSLNLSKNLDLMTGIGFSTIFSKFKTSPDLIVPHNYMGDTKNTINQFITTIGFTYKF